MRKLPGAREGTQKGLEETVPRTHTELENVPVLISQMADIQVHKALGIKTEVSCLSSGE